MPNRTDSGSTAWLPGCGATVPPSPHPCHPWNSSPVAPPSGPRLHLPPSTLHHSLPLAAFLPQSRVNGPGLRAVLWVQGCPFRCPGCFNPDFQPFEGGTPTPVHELAERILADPETGGLTFSGGEPFAHAAPLAELAEQAQAAGKGVLVFTGYAHEELRDSDRDDWHRLLAASDLLVAGRYNQDEPMRHPLLASANQELVQLTDLDRQVDPGPARRRAEIHIAPDGTIATTGFVTPVPTVPERKQRSQ